MKFSEKQGMGIHMGEVVRLNKFLADCGVCSRRDADKWIEKGAVTVNGKVAMPGMKVTEDDFVCFNGRPLESKNKKVVLAYYKPVGVVCTERDAHATITVRDVFKFPVRVTYAGRLDKDSEGLLLMTNDGILIQRCMKAAEKHEKEYIVKVKEEITDEFVQKMSQGVYLKELNVTTRPCVVEKIGKYTFRIILTQGLNRQIRRMCKECKNQVTQLKRVRVMNIELGQMKPGSFREIKGNELEDLYRLAGLRQES